MGKNTILLLIILLISNSTAEIKSRDIEYNHGETKLKGSFFYDPLLKSVRSGVLLIHDIWGIDAQILERATKMAELGHIVFVADLYGPETKIASIEAGRDKAEELIENKPLIRERINLAMDQLRSERKTDQGKLGVIGYGFGATAAMELAATDPGVKAYVLYYPHLAPEGSEIYQGIKGSFMVFYGSRDPHVSFEARGNFQKLLSDVGVDWQMVIYGDAYGGFTNASLGYEVNEGMAYNYNADLRSFDAMRQFFTDLLK